MKKLFLSLFVVSLLSACGTSVPLTEAPVSDANPKSVPGSTANGSGVGGNTVAPVDLGKGNADANNAASRTVYFDYDSYVIKQEFQSIITAQASVAKAQPNRKVAIEGHTDESGGREYNLALGQKRADAVRSALSILGVQASQMESVSFGKEKPAVVGNDEAAYAKNRRVEIRYQ